ncbi:hypothetical protein VN0495_14950 [Helicobacter pylori]|nr:hypothetical protein VN0495_14950 [Helicobacter pylori]
MVSSGIHKIYINANNIFKPEKKPLLDRDDRKSNSERILAKRKNKK